MCKRAHSAPAEPEFGVEGSPRHEELFNLCVVGFPRVVFGTRKPVTNPVSRAFVIEPEVHEEILGLHGCPVQRLVAIERMKVKDSLHAVHD